MLKKIDSFMCGKFFIYSVLIVFFKPLLFFYYPTINSIFNVAMMLFGIAIFIYYVLNLIKGYKISSLQLAIMGYFIVLAIATIIGTHDYGMLLRTCGKWLSISIYSELLITKHHEKFLSILNKFILVLILLQFLSVLIFPNGILNINNVQIYFLGNENTTTMTVILGTLYTMLYSYYKNNRLSMLSIAVLLMTTVIYIITWSATAIVGLLMLYFFLFCLYKKNKKLFKVFNFRNYLIFAIVGFILLVLFQFQNLFSFFIEDILHKELTLSGRIFIWDGCIEYIKSNFLLGLGVQEYSMRLSTIGIFHAHCTFLNILLEGGILGLVCFLNILRVISKPMKKHKKNEIVNIISFGLFIYLVTAIVEVYQDSQMVYIFMVLGYCSNIICKECKNEKNISSN